MLVEGGPTVIGSFLKAKLADEVVIYIAPKILDTKGAADISPATNNLRLCRAEIKHIRDDIRITGMTEAGIEEIGETNFKKGVRK